ncbi:MAG TPA: hypothetical protein VKS01_06365 [Bryobacteraceae bacterium]|nr:hypothetical protein [Bryobacteraceae bacterium]
MFALAKHFLAHVLPHVTRPLLVLWNEVIALLFFLIAIPATLSAITHFRRSEQDPHDLLGAIVAAIFAAVMIYFAVTSWLRARRLSR